MSTQDKTYVCSLDEIKHCKTKVVQVNGRNIALFYSHDQVYAMDQQCYHAGGPLQEGQIKDIEDHPCVICPWHRYIICMDTGESLYQHIDPKNLKKPPVWKTKGIKQRTHQVVVENNYVYVCLSDLSVKCDSDYYQSEEYRTKMGAAGRKK